MKQFKIKMAEFEFESITDDILEKIVISGQEDILRSGGIRFKSVEYSIKNISNASVFKYKLYSNSKIYDYIVHFLEILNYEDIQICKNSFTDEFIKYLYDNAITCTSGRSLEEFKNIIFSCLTTLEEVVDQVNHENITFKDVEVFVEKISGVFENHCDIIYDKDIIINYITTNNIDTLIENIIDTF